MSSKISSQADSQMPWDLLKGDTMKAIFKDLGLNQYVGKREDMLERLQEVEKDGLEAVFEKLEHVDHKDLDDEREHSPASRRRPGPQNDTHEQAPRDRPSGSRAGPSMPGSGNRIASGSSNKPIFEGVILPASNKTRKQILIGVVVPPVSKSQAGRENSMKRKAESDDDEDEREPSTISRASTKGKRRASRQEKDSDDGQS